MQVKQIKRNISKLDYDVEQLIATPYGSLIQSYLILNGIKWENAEFLKRMKKGKFPFLDDKQFIKKTLEAVGLEYINIVNKPLALCESDYNSIFCPFVIADDEIVLLPLYRDQKVLKTQELCQSNDSYKIINWQEYDEEEIEC